MGDPGCSREQQLVHQRPSQYRREARLLGCVREGTSQWQRQYERLRQLELGSLGQRRTDDHEAAAHCDFSFDPRLVYLHSLFKGVKAG